MTMLKLKLSLFCVGLLVGCGGESAGSTGGQGGAASSSVDGSGGAGTGAGGAMAQGGGGAAGSSTQTGSGGSVASAYRDAVLADSPVAYWRLGDTAGATAKDEAGGHAGMYQGAFTLGASGALTGDGNGAVQLQGGRVLISDTLDFSGTAPFSLEVWAKAAVLNDAYARLVSKEVTDALGRQGYDLNVQQTGVFFDRWSNGANAFAYTSTAIPTSAFTYIVATWDGGSMRLYVGGAVVHEVPNATSLADSPGMLVLGADTDGLNAFQGVLDEIAIYDKALAPDRIAAHYAIGIGAAP